MTTDQEARLVALLGDVCSSDDATSFADRWGRSEPSRRRPGGVRVACDVASPFDSLEIRPWTDDVTGVVEVEVREGEGPLAWADVRQRFGPFGEMPRLHDSPVSHAATWLAPGAPATALLIVGVAGDSVESITVRRDPR